MDNNILKVVFGEDRTSMENYARSTPLWQYDYGQKLLMEGIELPLAYEVHFSNKRHGDSVTVVGDDTGVDIPDEMLLSGQDVYAWVYLHETESDGETEYMVTIPVNKRAKPTNQEPTPVQQDVIDQTIAALQVAVARSETNVTHYPCIIDGYWYVWDAEQNAFVNTEVSGHGEKGDDGNGIARITLNDDYTLTFYYTNGTSYTTGSVRGAQGPQGEPGPKGDKGDKGDPGKPMDIIDDTAGAGETERAWSADKLVTELGTKADKTDTVLNTTLSRGRKANSTVGQYSVAFGHDAEASGALSQAIGLYPTASGVAAHAEGNSTTASGEHSHAEGSLSAAYGVRSHAEGYGTVATGPNSHAEGNDTSTAQEAQSAHAEGEFTQANAQAAHAEGMGTRADGYYAHSEGDRTVAFGNYGHAEGSLTAADGTASHAEGYNATANGNYSHVEGDNTYASGQSSHAEGVRTEAAGLGSHAEGNYSKATGQYAHAEGARGDIASKMYNNVLYTVGATGARSHAEGNGAIAAGAQAHAEGNGVFAIGENSHAEGVDTKAVGNNSHAEGNNSIASGANSHAEGRMNTASGNSSHAEGQQTIASGTSSHAEGSRGNAQTRTIDGTSYTVGASNDATHAEGFGSLAAGVYSHAEGSETNAIGVASHSEGSMTTSAGDYSHTEGIASRASGQASHAEGIGGYYSVDGVTILSQAGGETDHIEGYMCETETPSSGNEVRGNHAEGYQTRAIGGAAHSEGHKTVASGWYSHAEGYDGVASGSQSHAEGYMTTASGPNSHSEGASTTASGTNSHAEGAGSSATEAGAHAEGAGTIASGYNSHAEGCSSKATGAYSHAEGYGGTYTLNGKSYTSEARGTSDHVEGYQCETDQRQPGNHAEGYQTHAMGGAAHSEGSGTIASGANSHAEGVGAESAGYTSHAEGQYTKATGAASHVSGRYNVEDDYSNWEEWVADKQYHVGDKVKVTSTSDNSTYVTGYICNTDNSDSTFNNNHWTYDTYRDYAEIIGNGIDDSNRSNARTLDWEGNEELAGDLTVNKGTANEVSVGDLKSAINVSGETSDASGVDLDITDENGNVIARFEGGHVQTKNFDSAKSAEGVVQGTDPNADLYLTDENGNGIARFSDGNIQTKHFNSNQLEYKKTFAYADASGKQTIIKFFPKGTALVFHLAKPENGSEGIANQNVTYSYTDISGTEHEIGKDSGYNYFKCKLPNDAVSVSVSYGSGLLWGFSGTLLFSVFSEANYDRKPTVVTLGTNKQYTSLREAVEAVAPMASDFTPCEIHIYPGTYEVLEDFTTDEIAVNDFNGLMLTNGISLIGIGSRDEIIISASMNTSTYDTTKRNKVSTLNIQGNVKLENLTVTAENIRYAVHDDFGSLSGKINNHVFINVKMFGTNLTTGDISFGAGGGNYKRVYAKDCDFTGTFLVHNSDSNVHSMKVYLENCTARMFSFPDYNAGVPTYVYMRNCKTVFISIAKINGPHDQYMFIDGEGTCGAMVYCPEGYIYNTGDCKWINKEQISAGYAVKMKRKTYHSSNSIIETATDSDDVYGISIGTDGTGTVVQVSGYISSNTLGISGLSVGDYLTVDSNGAVVSGGTSANGIAKVVFVDEDEIAYAKLMF